MIFPVKTSPFCCFGMDKPKRRPKADRTGMVGTWREEQKSEGKRARENLVRRQS